ncbi:unnamed protein product, partial [Staurois parvus]
MRTTGPAQDTGGQCTQQGQFKTRVVGHTAGTVQNTGVRCTQPGTVQVTGCQCITQVVWHRASSGH